jgi:hypothetical protein
MPASTLKVVTVGPKVIWALRQRENADPKTSGSSLFTVRLSAKSPVLGSKSFYYTAKFL